MVVNMKKIKNSAFFITLCFVFITLTSCTSNPPSLTTQEGDTVTFGGHKWLVLDVQENRALIISSQILMTQDYQERIGTWDESALRQQLNGAFYRDTFSGEEKERIIETNTTTPPNRWAGTYGGGDTTDKIFLLSLEEVVKYFGDSGQLANRPQTGDIQHTQISDEYSNLRIAKHKSKAVYWWLRTQGIDGFNVVVDDVGDIAVCVSLTSNFGAIDIDFYVGIRPALWVSLA
ncbi:MAG: DUF6273 domain-containing protein [Oscillospiraceae bacterium]|nr:DUF6273 domain-containing protein [Oscillospiraceae bacterium]